MANLETLELTINANAESASKGLSKLIDSLSSLSKKINEAFNGMSKLNSEIKKLGANGGINVGSPTVAASHRTSSGVSRATRAAKSSVPSYAIPAPNQLPNGSLFMAPDGRTLPIITNAEVKEVTNYAEATKEAAKETSLFDRVSEKAKETMGSLSKGLGRIGRIFSTMLIRTVLKSLIKSFQNAWSSAYEFSKHMGGEFAESVDKAKTLLAGAATSIVSAFSPAITALLPVIQSVVGAIQYLCKAIQWLFSLLGMSNELFGASTDAINAYAKSSGGAGKANKEMLASFDELNVISQESGGGGGGGGGASYKNGLFSDVVSDEMAKVQLIVSESLLALGLILACTGHFGIGLGLMAIGAAGIAKTVIADWGALSTEMQGQLATIMSIVGVSTLAIGAILAFSGANIPLGIGLMAIGALNLGSIAYLNWGGKIPGEVQKTITEITGIVGVALLAVGAILAFSGVKPGLGIGLMAAGALSLGTAVALNWNSIENALKGPVGKVVALISGALLAVGAILTFTGVKAPLGIALMAAGALGLGTVVALNWNSMKNALGGPVAAVTALISGALLAVGAILAFTGVKPGLGIALIAAGAVGLASVAALNWNSIENALKGPVGRVTALVSAAVLAVGAILAFTGVKPGLGVALMASGALGLGTVAALNWNSIENALKGPIGRVTALISAATLVVGGILTFTGVKPGLGIALMAAGAIGLATVTALNWNSVENALRGPVGAVTALLSGALLAIGGVLTFTGVRPGLGIALMASGALGLASVVALNWNSIKNALEGPIGTITGLVSGAFLVLGAILAFTGVNIPLGIALLAAGGVGIVAAIAPNWDSIVSQVERAFRQIVSTLLNGWGEVLEIVREVKELIEFVTGTHTVEIIEKVTTEGTPQNNFVSSAMDKVISTAKNGNIVQKALGTAAEAITTMMNLSKKGSSGGHGFASGGFPSVGEIFVAQEHGAELIGEINGKTSVANQQQIIEGIASGVERANNEQNMLLRQQNELLRGILEKDASVRIGASASLGRVAKQSLEMYGSMVGG